MTTPALVYDKHGQRYEWNAAFNAYWSVSGEPRQLQPGEMAPHLTIGALAQHLDKHASLVEKAVANLDQQALVFGYHPGEWDSPIFLSEKAQAILK